MPLDPHGLVKSDHSKIFFGKYFAYLMPIKMSVSPQTFFGKVGR